MVSARDLKSKVGVAGRSMWSDRVFAKLVADFPEARTYLVTSARRDPACERVAQAIARSIASMDVACSLLSVAGTTTPVQPPESAVQPVSIEPRHLLAARELQGMLSATDRGVAWADGLLDRPEPVLLAAAVDAVVVVVRRGVTSREDLREVRADIGNASLALAVLIA